MEPGIYYFGKSSRRGMNNIASAWRRLFAYLIDMILFLTLECVLLLWVSQASDITTVMDRLIIVWIICAVGNLFIIFINCYLISESGGTVGKLLTFTAIVRPDRSHLSFKRALFRNYIGYMVSDIFFLGFIWVLIDRERRGWHDQIADTYVISTHKTGGVMGLAVLLLLAGLNFHLLAMSFRNYSDHSGLYRSFIISVGTELKQLGQISTPSTPNGRTDKPCVDFDQFVLETKSLVINSVSSVRDEPTYAANFMWRRNSTEPAITYPAIKHYTIFQGNKNFNGDGSAAAVAGSVSAELTKAIDAKVQTFGLTENPFNSTKLYGPGTTHMFQRFGFTKDQDLYAIRLEWMANLGAAQGMTLDITCARADPKSDQIYDSLHLEDLSNPAQSEAGIQSSYVKINPNNSVDYYFGDGGFKTLKQ
jgi:uncharacterized RDD family membrane protein YckC